MRHFKKEKYIKLGRWLTPTLAWVPWMYWGRGGTISKLQLPEIGEYVMFDGYGFLNKDAVDKIQKRAKEKIEKGDYGFFDIWFSEADSVIKRRDIFRKKQLTSVRDKVKLFSDYMDWYAKITQNWQLVFIIEDVVQEFIEKNAAQERISADDISSYLRPIKPTLIMQEHASIELMQRKIKSGKDIKKDIKKHLEEYEWVGTHHFWGNPLTEKMIRDEISKELPKDKIEPDALPKNMPSVLLNAILFAQKIIWLRTYSAEISDLSSFKLRPIMADIAKRNGLTYEDLIWLTTEEIVKELAAEECLQRINDRKIKYGMYLEKGKISVVTGKDVDVGLKELLGDTDSMLDVQEISGKIGNKGCAQGIVRIMLTPKDSGSFREGEILVAPETTPDFVPMMKKASAFVTEQGGITSHAAIVAREMNKPCIIGTKIATKVLKDGDLVEVDAEKGVVKIIKRK